MTNPDYTAILFINDESGSMFTIRDDMNGAINQVLEDQKALPGKVTIDVAYFDTKVTYEEKFLSLDEAKIDITPGGGTALFDAIVHSVTEFGKALAELPEEERPGTVLTIIVTDGEENSSKENTLEDVNKIVTQQQDEYNWQFLFLGANQDAFSTGASFGFRQGASYNYTANAAGTVDAATIIARSVSSARLTGTIL
jgi:hypothetical protein